MFPEETWEARSCAHGTLGCRLSPDRTWEAKSVAHETSERRSFLNRIRGAGPLPKGMGGAEVFPGAGRGRTLQVDWGPWLSDNARPAHPKPHATNPNAKRKLEDSPSPRHAFLQFSCGQNIQSTYSQHTVNTIHFSLFLEGNLDIFKVGRVVRATTS